jgi:hypothetical protein
VAIFARRVLKRCLDENSAFVSPEKLNDWVQRLNDISDRYAATEWEIVLTNRFAKLGTVEHERQESAWIDLVFNSSNSSISFAADIITISDHALHKRNPVEALWEELRRRIRHVVTGGFSLQIGEKKQRTHPGSGNKRQLLLPPVAEFGRLIFNDNFRKFLGTIRLAPSSGSYYHAVSLGVDVLITYVPGRVGVFQGAHGSYTDTTVVDDNPLFNALEKKAKGKQLKKCKFSGPKGLIVCDGGCRMLDEPLSHDQTYSVEQVVRKFFRNHKSIDFVSTIAIKSDFPTPSGPSHRYVHRVFVAPGQKLPEEKLRGVLADVVRSLPVLQMTPENAVRRSKFTKSTGRYLPHRGGWEISGMKARISARSLLELMAGRLDPKQFAKNHEIGGANFFEHKLKRGELITSACVERQPDEDDDWITFEFGPPDVAVAAFESPAPKTDKTKG